MTSQARKDLEAQFAIGLESAAALSAQGKSVCCVISEDRSDGTVIVRMHPEFRGRLQYGTELYVSAAPRPAQQHQERTALFQYLDQQVAKDMAGFYAAFGMPVPQPEQPAQQARQDFSNAGCPDECDGCKHEHECIHAAEDDTAPQSAQQTEQQRDELIKAEREIERLDAENKALREALTFYANGEHYNTDPDECFDTVSGEGLNWLFSGLDESTTLIENGSVAKHALEITAPQPAKQPTTRYEPTDEGIGND